MPKDLTSLFCPKSVAVIGASRSAQKVGAIVLRNIIESKFQGKIYPVNPHAKTVSGLKCFKDVASLPEVPDLAVIAIPAAIVVKVLDQVGEKGIKNAVVFAAGFKEIGEEGEKLEKELVGVAEKFEINLLGPNCLGFVNNNCPINTTFGEPVNELGNLRFISQSGAIAASLFDWCKSTGLGISEFATLGNKAVLNENDILQHFLDQSQNSLRSLNPDLLSDVYPIGLYLESISNGPEFLRITRQISQRDPIFVIKPGKTQAAVRAMQSHTGAIAGEDDILEALLTQAGVTRCQTLEDFFDLSRAFAWEKIPVGPKVAIVSNAGGPAVISADAVVNEGLELTEFDAETKAQLSQILPRAASIINPVDVLGDALAESYAKASEVILQMDDVHSLLVILTPQIMTQIEKTAELIGKLSEKYQKPTFCSFIGGSLVKEGERILNEYKIPSFRFPERAIFAIGALWRFKMHQEKLKKPVAGTGDTIQSKPPEIEGIIKEAAKNNQKAVDSLGVNKILNSAGISTPATSKVSNLDEAKAFAQDTGWPVVLKLSSPSLLHKRRVGGVILDIVNEIQLEDSWNKLERRIIELENNVQNDISIQIQKDVLTGVEVIVGVKNDPTFGPVLLFGAGGAFAEIIADKNLLLLPLDASHVKELVKGSKVYDILKGYDGEPAYALDKLYDLIAKLAKLSQQIPEAAEIEINPVIVNLNDVWAVDGKLILEEGKVTPAVSVPKFQLASTVDHEILATKYHFYTFEAEEPLIFEPGQYITVKVANDAVRCYSIAGHAGPNIFNLLVDTSPGGPGSKFFDNLKAGDKIAYLGPFGIFTLKPDDGAKHLLFLTTGCGCSPVKSMIESALKEKNIKLPITLYFSLACSADVFWKDYFEKLSQEYSNFTFKIAVDKPDAKWRGHVGYITDLVSKDYPDASECSAYLCGSKPMIDNATKMLLENGCPKERIYTEKL